MKWSKLNPFKREVHCHVPLVTGETTTMDTVGGIVAGMVEHPMMDDLCIEFTGVVIDHNMDNDLFDEYLDAVEYAQKVLSEKVDEIHKRQAETKDQRERDAEMLRTFNPETDVSVTMEPGLTFSFWEGEDAKITAYGHRDKAEFAAEIQRYDDYNSGMTGSSLHSESEIDHRWGRATIDSGEIMIMVCDKDDPGAFPITIIWNSR